MEKTNLHQQLTFEMRKRRPGFEIMVVPVVIEALRVARRKRLVMC